MKVIAIINVSVNGKVILAEDLAQAPQEAVGIFVQKIIETGSLIIGRKTYEIIQKSLGRITQVFPGVEIVLLSSTNNIPEDVKVVGSPEESIKYLQERGFNEIAVGGGTKTYNSFLNKELATDVYFNFIPVIIGNGGVLGTADELNTHFKLVGHRLFNGDIVQIHLNKA